jgi:hypothetical protein
MWGCPLFSGREIFLNVLEYAASYYMTVKCIPFITLKGAA